eukprot:6334711-Pyramimonas_sp.AAC.1
MALRSHLQYKRAQQIARMSRAMRWFQHPQGGAARGVGQSPVTLPDGLFRRPFPSLAVLDRTLPDGPSRRALPDCPSRRALPDARHDRRF